MTKLIFSILLFCSLSSHGQDKQFMLNKGNIQLMKVYDSTANANAIALKLNKSDTAAMLLAYKNAILAKLNISDTASMLAAYQAAITANTAAVAARVKYTDTAAMLLNYQTGLNAKAPTNGTNRQKWAVGNGNGSTLSAVNWTVNAIGTATTANVATTNRYTQSPGLEYLVTTPATNAIAGWRETATQNFIGSSAGNGGFSFICRFGPATGVSTTTTRSFTGMGSSAAAPTDVEPSSIINQIGVGWDAADANIQFITNDGTASPTNKIDLGIPVPTVDRTSLYEIRIYVAPNSSTVYYTFTDLAQGGSTVSGSTSSDLPAANTLLAAKGWISAGGTSSVIGYSLKSVWVESNF